MWNRIYSQVYKAVLSMLREGFRLMDITFWPLVLYFSMMLFAFYAAADRSLIGLITLGAIGWRLLYHFQIEPAQIFMDHHWTNSVEHLMISPLRRSEFVMAGGLIGLMKGIITGSIFLILSATLFHFTIANWAGFFIAALAIALSGLIIGIFSLGVVYIKGSDAFAFTFAFPDILAVLSGVFYPISLFPPLMQKIVLLLPTTQAFALMKSIIGIEQGSILNFCMTAAVWLVLAILFNNWAFNKARKEGKLVKMK